MHNTDLPFAHLVAAAQAGAGLNLEARIALPIGQQAA